MKLNLNFLQIIKRYRLNDFLSFFCNYSRYRNISQILSIIFRDDQNKKREPQQQYATLIHQC